jgi:hypothetical protein
MPGIHEHPHSARLTKDSSAEAWRDACNPAPDQAARLRAARTIGASPDMASSAPVAVLAVVFGALMAVVMVCVLLGMVAARLVSAPATWLGVVVVAVLAKMMGAW